MRAVTGAQVRAMDAYALSALKIEQTELIERSGRALYAHLKDTVHARFCILCGGGNNGADSVAAGRLLAQSGRQVFIVVLFERCNESCGKLLLQAARAGCKIERYFLNPEVCKDAIVQCDCIVDGIFGTGFRCDRENAGAQVIDYVNSLRKTIYAVDIPSGADSDSGKISSSVIRAKETLTLAYYKPGLFIYPAAEYCGVISLLNIGMPEEAIQMQENLFEISQSGFHKTILKKRRMDAHKGDFGHLFVIGGSIGMSGSVALASRAAQRSGAGRVTIGCPDSIADILAIKMDETMTYPMDCDKSGALASDAAQRALAFLGSADAVALGCGMRCGDEQTEFVRRFLVGCTKPLVLDADALNAVSHDISMLEDIQCDVILTPHPGELARLLNVSINQINQYRLDCAKVLTKKYGVTVLLKGAGSIVSFPDGTVFVNTSGNPGMAKGGSGDMLTGMIGALLAQNYTVKDAVKCAVYLHGYCGDLCAQKFAQQSYLPSDMIEMLKFI